MWRAADYTDKLFRCEETSIKGKGLFWVVDVYAPPSGYHTPDVTGLSLRGAARRCGGVSCSVLGPSLELCPAHAETPPSSAQSQDWETVGGARFLCGSLPISPSNFVVYRSHELLHENWATSTSCLTKKCGNISYRRELPEIAEVEHIAFVAAWQETGCSKLTCVQDEACAVMFRTERNEKALANAKRNQHLLPSEYHSSPLQGLVCSANEPYSSPL